MKMTSWNWIELFGFISLAVSLIFVGIQLKQNQDISKSIQYLERQSIVIDIIMNAQSKNEIILNDDLLTKHLNEMNLSEILYTSNQMNIFVTSMDNCHFQYQKGFIEQEAWDVCKHRFQSILRNCNTIFLWEKVLSNLQRIKFVDEVKSWNISLEDCSNLTPEQHIQNLAAEHFKI